MCKTQESSTPGRFILSQMCAKILLHYRVKRLDHWGETVNLVSSTQDVEEDICFGLQVKSQELEVSSS